MTSTSKAIIHKSLNELRDKRDECEAELRSIDGAITSLEGILLDMGEKADKTKPIEFVATGIPTKKRPKRVSEKDIRDAVIRVGKNPPIAGHFLEDGFFTISHICSELLVHKTNQAVRKALKKFANKGMLETKPYKNGEQYRYLDPATTGPGRAAKIDISTPISTGVTRPISDPVPGTSNKQVHTSDKDVEQFLRSAQRQGYTVTHMGSGHKKVSNGSGPSIVVSGTHTGSAAIVKKELKGIGVSL